MFGLLVHLLREGPQEKERSQNPAFFNLKSSNPGTTSPCVYLVKYLARDVDSCPTWGPSTSAKGEQ